MSFHAKAELLKALNANQALVNLCSGGFHNRTANDISAYPRIVYTEIRNSDDEFTDNQAISSDVRFQLSIFTTKDNVSNETPIAIEVDNTMKSLGYTRYDSNDSYELNPLVYHKAMRYQKSFY